MTKLEMAHEYALRMIINGSRWGDNNVDSQLKNISINAWKLADAMQAEANKRSDMERPAVSQDEWQPDWSLAPEWAVAWTIDKNAALWWSDIPSVHLNIWFMDGGIWQCCEAPSFGYQGSWENSLRKRP